MSGNIVYLKLIKQSPINRRRVVQSVSEDSECKNCFSTKATEFTQTEKSDQSTLLWVSSGDPVDMTPPAKAKQIRKY